MNIGELARRSGLTASRIRFYERVGLLAAAERRPNGYRAYPPEAVVVLELIAVAQKAGFSLDEIRRLLPADLEDWQHDALLDALRRRVADIEALEARLAASKAQILSVIAAVEEKPDDLNCAANARRVLSDILGQRAAPGEVGAAR